MLNIIKNVVVPLLTIFGCFFLDPDFSVPGSESQIRIRTKRSGSETLVKCRCQTKLIKNFVVENILVLSKSCHKNQSNLKTVLDKKNHKVGPEPIQNDPDPFTDKKKPNLVSQNVVVPLYPNWTS